MMKNKISKWWLGLAKVFRNEFGIVRNDVGAMLFFVALPLLYPVVYTLIYNPEIVTDVPVAVVDNCRTALSREAVTDFGASPAVEIYGYANDMAEARRWMAEEKVAAIVEIPENFEKDIAAGVQSTVPVYFDMKLLLKYRALYGALTEYQIAQTANISLRRIEEMGVAQEGASTMPLKSEANFLGDPEQGFASFVMPGILILIIQQSMVLGITLLAGSSRERRRRNRGYDPLMVSGVSVPQLIWGKSLCYIAIYIPITFYVLHFVPEMFNLPHYGSIWDYFAFVFPMLLASAMFGQILSYFTTERESCFLVIVFTSVLFLFLTGLTWPRYAIHGIWSWVGDLVPATWGVQGFIKINSNGATLLENSYEFIWLWALTVLYFFGAWGVTALITRKKEGLIPFKKG